MGQLEGRRDGVTEGGPNVGLSVGRIDGLPIGDLLGAKVVGLEVG